MYHLFLYLLYQTLKYYILLLPNGVIGQNVLVL